MRRVGKFSRRVQAQHQQIYLMAVHYSVGCGSVATDVVLLPLVLLFFMDIYYCIYNIVIIARVPSPVLGIGAYNKIHNDASLYIGAPLTLWIVPTPMRQN